MDFKQTKNDIFFDLFLKIVVRQANIWSDKLFRRLMISGQWLRIGDIDGFDSTTRIKLELKADNNK